MKKILLLLFICPIVSFSQSFNYNSENYSNDELVADADTEPSDPPKQEASETTDALVAK